MTDRAYIYAEDIGYFIFDIDGTTTHQLESDITDHYVEDNTAVQDHIALRPEEITLKNYQGELLFGFNDLSVINSQKLLKPIDNSLTSIVKENTTVQTNQKKTIINNTVISKLRPLNNSIIVSSTGNRQQGAYNFFKSLRKKRILVSVNTPYGYLTNMFFKSITPFQDEDSRFISTFTLTLKQMNFVDTIVVPFDATKNNSNTVIQQQNQVTSRIQGKTTNSLVINKNYSSDKSVLTNLVKQIYAPL